uniref:Uncharacterized protein n=1 Tax=Brassica oleracea var. oleracea TaxID=109376 RepID=A0A0D3BTE4_BRAOL
MEPIEERMYMSKASHLDVPKHQRTPIWTEEAAGFHKRVKRIHDHVKIMVPYAVFEAESPIPQDRSMQFSSYIEVLDDHQHVEASQRGLRFEDGVDKGPAEPVSIDTDRIPSIDTNKPASIDTTTSPSINTTASLSIYTDRIPSIDTNKPASIDTTTSPSIDTTASPSIDSTTSSSIDTGRVLSIRSSLCVEILGMEIPPRDQTSLGERRRGIGRRGKGPREVMSENPECAGDASQRHLQRFEHSLLLR